MIERLSQLEARFERLFLENQDTRRKLTQALQQIRDTQARPVIITGGGEGVFYWIVSPGFAAATGTSGAGLSPTVATGLTVWKTVGGAQTSHATSQTVRWWFKDAGAVGKLVPVLAASDGSGWDAIADSCTRVDT